MLDSQKNFRREQLRPEQPQQNKQPLLQKPVRFDKPTPPKISGDEKNKFKGMLEDLIGTRGAYILDTSLTILGKVPLSELPATVKSLGTGIYAIVFDGEIDKLIVSTAERCNVQYLVGMDTKVNQAETKVVLLTSNDV